MKNIAIIVAAGKGSRMQGEIPKQYLRIGHKSILQTCLEAFLEHSSIDGVVAVINEHHLSWYQNHVKPHQKLVPPIFGGQRRQDSVRIALEHIAKYHPKNVVIHDAARPFLKAKYITPILHSLNKNVASCLVKRVKDTMRYIKNASFKTIERDNLFTTETPQAFKYKNILELHKKFINCDFTDDISLLEQENSEMKIAFLDSQDLNFKITTEDDYLLAKMISKYNE